MQELRHPSLQSGQHVEVRGEPWQVVTTECFDRNSLVTMRGIGDDNRGDICRILTPFDVVRPLAYRTRLARTTRRRVLQAAVESVVSTPRWNDCWSAGSAHIDLRAWQLEPALAAVAGASRILLADEVGLGKTIQAALIVSELMARGLAERVMVLTPASLRDQWAAEFSDKFGLATTVFDHASLAALTAALPVGVNPWKTAPLAIASIDLVKRPEVRQAIDEVSFDILVIDEAHHVTPGTDRGAVVVDLAGRTPWLVMATATPHSGDESAYEFLCGLGGGTPLVTYRRTTRQVRTTTARRIHLFAVTPTSAERALLDATLAYGGTLWRRTGNRPGLRLVASVIARRAASSAVAARQTLERRLALIRGDPTPVGQPSLPWDEGDSSDASEVDEILGLEGLDNRNDEIEWLQRLIELAVAAAPASSKVAVIRKFLRRTTEHLIIFSEYRDVVQAVAAQIRDLAPVAVIHGGLTAAARGDLVRAFTTGDVRALVTTDAAGEGLNLQARCRVVVNLELPWNPLRLEQRIGRVDRLGQKYRVHAVHLFHRGSFEDTVTARLERRRARAAAVLSHINVAYGVEAIAAAVFDGTVIDDKADLMPPALPPPACEAGAFAETERRLRALVSRSERPLMPGRPVYVQSAPGRRPIARVVLLFATGLMDDAGRLAQRELLPLQLDIAAHGGNTRHLTRDLVGHLTGSAAVRGALEKEIANRLAITATLTAKTATAIERRASSILAAIGMRPEDQLFQGSLFDRRTEQRRQARHLTIQMWQQHLTRRMHLARAWSRLHASEPRLVAAWPVSIADKALHASMSTPPASARAATSRELRRGLAEAAFGGEGGHPE